MSVRDVLQNLNPKFLIPRRKVDATTRKKVSYPCYQRGGIMGELDGIERSL